MATKVRGQFDEFQGSARLDGDDPSKSSAELTIQAKSIQTRNQQRDEHLRSNSWTWATTRPSPSPRPG